MNGFIRPVLIFSSILAVMSVGIALFASKAPSGLYISEVCAHNNEVMHDAVGFYNDYIKVCNPSDTAVNLAGYSLSDNAEEPDRFVFESIILEPGADKMVWAGNKEAFFTYGEKYYDDEALYTGFRLSDHEMVYLSDPDGAVIDSLRLPEMKDNSSFLRTHAGDPGRVGTPTDLEVPPPVVSNMVAPPVFSAPSGFYDDPFILAADGGGNTVYFTLDGSSPYTTGMRYEAGIPVEDRTSYPNYYSTLVPVSAVFDQYVPTDPVSKATVVRAVSQAADGTFSKETVAVFFIGNEIKDICRGAYTVSIVSDPEGLFSGDRGIYVTGHTYDMNKDKAEENHESPYYVPANYNMHGRGWGRKARLSLFDPAGDCLYEEDDIIRIHGQSSRSTNQKGFNILPGREGERVFDGLFPDAGDTLMLRTGSENDMYSTNFRDALNGLIAGNLAVNSQKSVCAQLYLNGEYWGCYNLQERLDASFVERRTGVTRDNVNIVKVDPEPEAVSDLPEDVAAYRVLADFVNSHDLADPANYAEFCRMMDIDSMVDYFIAEMFFANDDAYYGNLGMWRVRKKGFLPYEDGKWRYLLFDLDNTDGYLQNAYANIDSFVDGSWSGSNPDTDPFFSNVSKNAEFRKKFRDRFLELIDTDFSYDRTGPMIDEMEKIYTKPVVLSARRFKDPNFRPEWYKENVESLRRFFKERGRYMSEYVMLHMGDGN